MSMDFEKAKQEWLKSLGGKSLEEYEEAQDAAALKAAEKLLSDPENEKIWEEADKDSEEQVETPRAECMIKIQQSYYFACIYAKQVYTGIVVITKGV